MDSSQSDTSGGERRLSTAASVRSTNYTTPSTGATEESYPLEDLFVADGFRPSHNAPGSQSSTSRPGSSHAPPQPLLLSPLARLPLPTRPEPSSSSHTGNGETLLPTNAAAAPDVTNKGNPSPSIPRPSSTSKPHRPHESFTLRNDGSSTTVTNSLNTSQPALLPNETPLFSNDSPSHGSSSSSQQFGFLADNSRPGPSHSGNPMTEGEYNGPRGPTHPYALYPQNTAMNEELASQHIPIGFPGHAITYQRQVGPDGEEIGDLVGPLGHMEELPPYTRYPAGPYVSAGGQGVSVSSNAGTAGGDGSGSPSAPASVSAAPNTSADASSIDASMVVSTSASGSGSVAGSGSPRNSAPPPADWQADASLATRNPEYSPNDPRLAPVHGSNQSIQTGESITTTSLSINVAAKDFAEKIDVGGKWHRRARKKLWGVVPCWAICLMLVGLIIVGIVLGAVVGTMMSNGGGKGSSGPQYPYGEVPTPADVEPLSTLPSNLAPLIVGLFDLPPLEVSQAPRLCFNDTTQSQAWNCDMPLRWYSMEVGRVPNASQTENYEMTLTSVNGSDNLYLWGTQPPSIVEPVQLTLVNDTFEVSRGPAWWFKMNYNKQVILSESSFTATHQKREWEYDGPPRPGFDPTRFMSKNPGPEEGEKPWFCTWPNTTMEVFIYPSQNISVRYTSTSSTSSAAGASATGSTQDQTVVSSYDPTPAYPQVIKFMERRLFMDGDEEAATCRQVKITNGGRDKEDLMDANGRPIEVIVVERMRTYEELVEAANRNRHPDRRWLAGSSRADEYNPLVKRESLELTDCGCLWWST